MNGKEIAILATSLAIGGITTTAISEKYGDTVLGLVLGLSGGSIAGSLTTSALDYLDEETGIVSDIGSLIDDVFDIF